MRTWMTCIGLAVGLTVGAAAETRAQAGWPDVATAGDCDLTHVLDAAGLSGSAPMVGEPRFAARADAIAASNQAERDFDAVLADLGLSGTAPLVGLHASADRVASEAAPVRVVRVRAAAPARPGTLAIVKGSKRSTVRQGRER